MHSDSDDFASDDEQVFIQKKSLPDDRFREFFDDKSDEDEEVDQTQNDLDEPDELEDEDNNDDEPKTKKKNLKASPKLSAEKLEKEKKRIKKTGVCYLLRIPPYMKPAKVRSVLLQFGKVDRLFLKPEDAAAYHRRKKYGGNKKKNYTEGWVEFVNKKDAKICASTLNANTLGGKKTSYYHDDVINIKYLPGYKWFDLTQQIAKENEVRQAKLALEISQQSKLNKTFIQNIEQSKRILRRKAESTDDDDEVRRSFKQRKVTSTRADADDKLKEKSMPNDKLNDVLKKVF